MVGGRPPRSQWNNGIPAQGQVQQQPQRTDGVRTWQGNRNDPRLQDRDRNHDSVRDSVRDGRDNDRGRDWRGNNNRGNDWRANNNGGRDWRNHNDGGRDWHDNGGRGQSWNRDWRRDQRYNWQSYRSLNRSFYRLPRYQSPYGYRYGYQRFGIGVYLNSLLFSQDYWIDNPYEYRLPEAYPPYQWVRYYNDALLVDEESGYVVDTIYDVFVQ